MKAVLTFLAILWFIFACLAWDIRDVLPISVRPDDLVLVVMAVLVLLKAIVSGRLLYSSRWLLLIGSFVAMLMCISFVAYLLNTFFSSETVRVGTFGLSASTELLKEYARLLKYVLVVYIFSNLGRDLWKPAIVTVTVCCGLIILVQLLQYYQVVGINEALALVYGGGDEAYENFLTLTSSGSMENGNFRSGSIFGNPNVLGAFLVAPVLIMVMLTLETLRDGVSSTIKKILFLFVTCYLFLGIFMTQSRTALVACVAAVFACLVTSRRYLRLQKRHVLMGLSATLVVMFALLIMFSSAMTRYTLQYNDGKRENSSMGIKTKLTYDAIAELEVWKLVTGEGPAQSAMVDNEFGYMLLWYGFVGLIAYYIFYFVLYKVIVLQIDNVILRAAFTGMLIAYILLALSNSVFLNIRVFPIFAALLAIASQSVRGRVEQIHPACI